MTAEPMQMTMTATALTISSCQGMWNASSVFLVALLLTGGLEPPAPPPQRRAGAVDADRHLVVDDPDHHERLGVEIGGGGGRVGGGEPAGAMDPLGDGAGVVQP